MMILDLTVPRHMELVPYEGRHFKSNMSAWRKQYSSIMTGSSGFWIQYVLLHCVSHLKSWCYDSLNLYIVQKESIHEWDDMARSHDSTFVCVLCLIVVSLPPGKETNFQFK
jgi:hypothetical protein